MTEIDPLGTLGAIGDLVTAHYSEARLRVQGANDAMAIGALTSNAPGAAQVVVAVGYNGEITISTQERLMIELYLPGATPKAVAERVWAELRDVLRDGVERVRTASFLGPLSPSYVGAPSSSDVRKAKAHRWAVVVASAGGWGQPDGGGTDGR